MTQAMTDIGAMQLSIPPLWEKDWDNAIRNSEGIEQHLLKMQLSTVNLLHEINDLSFTFARLAWLNMWTKTFSILEGVLCASPKNSLYILNVLARAAFEQVLHLQTITEPINSDKEILARLNAYAAWCLWNDKILYNQIVQKENLDGAWCLKPAKEIANNEESLKAFEALFGQLMEEIDEKKLDNGKLLQWTQAQLSINRIDGLLNHPDLSFWYEKLQKLTSKKRRSVPFLDLAGIKGGVWGCLKTLNLQFGYPIYSVLSMGIHGSSMEQFVSIEEDLAIPLFTATEDKFKLEAEVLTQQCKSILVLLALLVKLLWPSHAA